MSINEYTIQNILDFTDIVIREVNNQRLYLFRGQSEDFPLLPSIARGKPTHSELITTEKLLIEDFKRLSLPFLKVSPSSLWDWIALAQHHRMPTRLLDWSLNPLVALWFVVQGPSISEKPGVVWLLRTGTEDVAKDNLKNQLSLKRNWIFAPSNVTYRVLTQVSWFTVHPLFTTHPNCTPLEKAPEFSDKLVKMVVPANCFANIRFQLSNMGVHAFSIFPDLDGLGSYLKWKEFYLPDEPDK